MSKRHLVSSGFPRRNIRFLNCGLPRLSREQISPSMTTLTFGKESEIDSADPEKEPKGCPLREKSRVRLFSMTASALNPSYFNSKIQSGSSHGAARFRSGIG